MKLLDIMTAPWALTPAKFTEVQEIYLRHARGQDLSVDELEKMRAATVLKPTPKDVPAEPYRNVNGVAVIPIEGVIAKKMNLLMDISGGTSTQLLSAAIEQALGDPQVSAILLQIDSPGGAVDGTQEIARQIAAARGLKPIVAYTDGLMASAAYWIGAAADSVYIASDTTEVGSIGVVATHVDVSKLEEARGIKTTEIVAGKFKRVASSYGPLTEIGRATIQEQVDHIYSVFVQDVATFRGVTPETVLKDMADGRIFLGQQAVLSGLVDGQRSLATLLRELSATRQQGGRMSGTAAVVTTYTKDDMDQAVKAACDGLRKEVFEAGKQEGITVGVAQERARLKAIDDLGLKGPVELIAAAKYTDPISADQLASKVVKADQELRVRMEQQFHEQAPKPVPHTTPQTATASPVDASEMAVAIQAKVDACAKQGRRVSYTEAARLVKEERQGNR